MLALDKIFTTVSSTAFDDICCNNQHKMKATFNDNLYLMSSFHTKKFNHLIKIFQMTSTLSPLLKTQNLGLLVKLLNICLLLYFKVH